MLETISRRTLLKVAAVGVPLGMKSPLMAAGAEVFDPQTDRGMVSDTFPAQPAELVRETVTVAHFDLKRVKELVEARPALARAAWDWGFGDWESPLGAASHMGNRAIAEYLLSEGAAPSLFSAAMLGQTNVVKALVNAMPEAQRVRGPHGISLLAHARVGGESARQAYDYLQSLPGSDMEAPVPLGEKDVAALLGTYVFGIDIAQQVELTADMQMYAKSKMYTYAPQLHWTRKGTMPRPLFHLGDRAFYPAGAPTARIQFRDEGQRVVMEVRDGEVVLSATRREPPKS